MNDFLKNLVPLIGGALGGPFGTIAATFAANALGLDSKDVKTVTDVLTGGKMTADQLTQLKLAELEMAKWMADNEIKREQLAIDNTKDARDMQKVTRSWVPAAISLIVVTGYFGILVGLMFGVLHVTDNQSLLILIGALSTAFGGVLNFWLGSSNSSQSKDVMLANSVPVK